MSTPQRLKLVEAPGLRDICETKMRYRLVLDGKPVGQAYFNMTGYCVTFHEGNPVPGFIGNEQRISTLRAEVRRWNVRNKQ